MKKRALTILAATVMAASILTGCSGVADIESDYDTESKNLQSMFVVVERMQSVGMWFMTRIQKLCMQYSKQARKYTESW